MFERIFPGRLKISLLWIKSSDHQQLNIPLTAMVCAKEVGIEEGEGDEE
jgi:hypothetical protein